MGIDTGPSETMTAPARKISAAVIGCQGLDVLHMMRLKVASSLLMAEYIQADVQEWHQQKVDLLVASIDDKQGQELLREAGRKGLPVLAVTRNVLSGLSIPGVAYGASVREIFQQLRQVELVDGDDDVGKGDPGEASELGPEDVLLLVLQGVVEQAVPVVELHQHEHRKRLKDRGQDHASVVVDEAQLVHNDEQRIIVTWVGIIIVAR